MIIARHRLPSADSPIAAAAILALAAELVFGAFWPGIIHFDASHIISEAGRGAAINWWTGIGTLALHAWLSVGLGVPLVWAAVVLANIVGFYGCLRLVLRRVGAAAVTVGF